MAKIGVQVELQGAPQYIENMSKLTAQTKLYSAQMKRVQQELSGASAFSKSINTTRALEQQLEALTNKSKFLQQEIEKEAAKDGELSAQEIRLRTQYENLQAEILKVTQALKDQGGTLGAISAQLNEWGNSLKAAGDKIAGIGDSLSTKVSAPLTAMGTAAVKTAATFDSSMSQVAATMGYSVDEINDKTSDAAKTLEQLSEFAQEMGKTTAFSASEAADALNYMALAGYDAETSMKMLPTVLNLAAAGGIELASASDMVTDAQSALGLSLDQTSKMVDQMAKASSKTNTSVAQLGEAILTVGGTAKNLAYGTEELTGVLGVLADNGIKGAEAGTHLRNIMLSLNPTTDAAVAAFEKLGVNAYTAEGELRGLDVIFGEMAASMENLSDQEKTDLLSKMFNKTDLASVNALLATNKERWTEVYQALDFAEGAAQNMADVQLNNFEGQLKLLKSALEGVGIQIGEILMPYIQDLVTRIQAAVEWFGSLDEGTQKTIVKIAALVAAIGPALSILGRFVGNVGNIVKALSVVVKFLPTVGGALSSLAGLFTGTIIPAITSFAATLTAGLTTAVSVITGTIIPAIASIGATILSGITAAITTIGTVITGTILPAIASLVAAIIPLLPIIAAVAAAIAAVVIVVKNWGAITDWISEKWALFSTFMSEKINELQEYFSTHFGLIGEIIAAKIEIIKTVIQAAVEIIKVIFQAFGETIKAVSEGDWSKVGEIIQQAFIKISTIILTAKAKILQIIVNMIKAVAQKFTELKNSAVNWGKDFVQGFVDGITERMHALLDKVREMADNIRSYLHFSHPDVGPLKDANQWPKDFVEQYAQGIESARYLIKDAVSDVASDVAVLQSPLDSSEVYQAIRSGASDATLRLAIGDREFGRALRDMGVVFSG